MPVVDRIVEFTDDIIEWRHDFHRHPELLYAVDRTAGIVADKLRAFGCDRVETGIGRSGVVGVVKGRHPGKGRVIGLRADMDALPIHEATNRPYASQTPGRMHACGHDGHTAMLLGAARYLADTRNFAGEAVLIFQPAEEGGAGAKAMLDDDLMGRFGIQEVFGLHNHPGLAVGAFAIRQGPIMASADWFDIEIEGVAGHAAKPQDCVDPILIAGHILTGVQAIVARGTNPLDAVVVSITKIQAGDAYNVIPQFASLHGTARTLRPEMRDFVEQRLRQIVEMTALSHGAKARLAYRRDYPVTVNHAKQVDLATRVAAQISGASCVNGNVDPELGSEDFAFMLEARPGAFIFAGNGDSAGHHHPEYDFNDDLLPVGASYWARLVEMAMPACVDKVVEAAE